MNEGDSDIGTARIARRIAWVGFLRHEGAGHHPYAACPPKVFGKRGAISDVQPDVESARWPPESWQVAEYSLGNREALPVNLAGRLDMGLVTPGGCRRREHGQRHLRGRGVAEERHLGDQSLRTENESRPKSRRARALGQRMKRQQPSEIA